MSGVRLSNKCDDKPFIDSALLRKHKSCGGVLGLVFDRDLEVRKSVSFDDVRAELKRIATTHLNHSKHAWDRLLYDIVELGLIPVGRGNNNGFFKHLGLDPSLVEIRRDLTGVTVNRTGPTKRYRYEYKRRVDDPMLIIDRKKQRFDNQSVKHLYTYARGSQLKSQIAGRKRAA